MKKNHTELKKLFILIFILISNITISVIAINLLKVQPIFILKLKAISIITIFIISFIFLALTIVRKPITQKFFYFVLMILYQTVFILRYKFNECILLAFGICYDIYYLFGQNTYLKTVISIICLLLLLKIIKKNIKLHSKIPLHTKNKIRTASRLDPQIIINNLLSDEKMEKPKQIPPADLLNITIIRKGGLGDILMTLPAVRGLKKKYPKVMINYIVHKNQFEALVPAQFIDNIIIAQNIFKYFFTLRKSDLIVDLENTIEKETDKPAIDLFCSLLNVQLKSKTIEYNIPIKYMDWADKFFLKNNIRREKPTIGIQVGSGSPSRAWDINNIKRLAQLLVKKDYYIILIGHGAPQAYTRGTFYYIPTVKHSKTCGTSLHPVRSLITRFTSGVFQRRHDKEYTIKGKNIISALGETSILQAAALIKKCAIFVCPDSGLLHLAAYIKAPTIALFGVISPHMRTTYYPHCRPVFNNLDCSPCNDHSQPPKCINEIRFDCMKSITAEQVLNEIETYMHDLSTQPFRGTLTNNPSLRGANKVSDEVI